MNPNRAIPAAAMSAPTRRARRPARPIAVALSPAASGTTAAAISGASDESGPRTRIRDGPKTAYARSGVIVAYRPVIAGSPAASA